MFSKCVSNNMLQASCAENVPHMLPARNAFPHGETHTQISPNNSSKLFLFKPREWRGPNTTETSNKYYISSYDLAQEINNCNKSTVTHACTTSNGGFSITDIFDMIGYLDDCFKINCQ